MFLHGVSSSNVQVAIASYCLIIRFYLPVFVIPPEVVIKHLNHDELKSFILLYLAVSNSAIDSVEVFKILLLNLNQNFETILACLVSTEKCNLFLQLQPDFLSLQKYSEKQCLHLLLIFIRFQDLLIPLSQLQFLTRFAFGVLATDEFVEIIGLLIYRLKFSDVLIEVLNQNGFFYKYFEIAFDQRWDNRHKTAIKFTDYLARKQFYKFLTLVPPH